MPRIYKNTGDCGPDYSYLSVEKFGTGASVELYGDDTDTRDVILNFEQVRDLRDRLTDILKDAPGTAENPLMSGETL